MFWVEIVHLRSASSGVADRVDNVYRQFLELLEKDREVSIRLLKDADFISDFMIVLEWHCKKWEFDTPPLKSTLGVKIFDKLREFGMVSHRVFLDQNDK